MEGGQFGASSIMNIFHKLHIHYPGTDIRAAAQGSWLGGGRLLSSFLSTFLAAWGHRALPLSPCGCWGVFSLLPMASSPLTLKLLFLLAPEPAAGPRDTCKEWERHECPGLQRPGAAVKQEREPGLGRRKASGLPPRTPHSDGRGERAGLCWLAGGWHFLFNQTAASLALDLPSCRWAMGLEPGASRLSKAIKAG